MAHSSGNPYLPGSTDPFLPASANAQATTSTNPYLPGPTDPYLPAPTYPRGPAASQHQSLENIPCFNFSNNTRLSPTEPYLPFSEPKKFKGKPFRQTHLGGLPLELREMIYTVLLATPPAFAGHDFAATSPGLRASSTARAKFIHIKASWRQVVWTCRQIYHEAHPIFFAGRAYFFGNCHEAIHFLKSYLNTRVRPILRVDTIAALCLSGFVETVPLYSKEQLAEILADPNDYRTIAAAHQDLEWQTFKTIWTPAIYCFHGLRSLRTISLCFLVGQELLHVNLLYGLTGMRRGFVEFVDASKWIIREQNPQDPWSLQYACFTSADFNLGKDNEELDFDRRQLEREVTDIDSRAPGLKEGDERFVEVSIRWSVEETLAQDPLSSKQEDRFLADTDDDSDLVSLHGDAHQAQLQITIPASGSDESDIEPSSGDMHEIQHEHSSAQAEENMLTENSEINDTSGEVQSDSNVSDGSPVLGLKSEDNHETMVTHQDSAGEEVSGVQSVAQCSRPAEDLSLTTTEDDQLSLPDTINEHDQTQDIADTNNNTAHAVTSQHTEDFHSKHSTETDHVQQNSNVSVGRPSHHTTGTIPSKRRIRPLPAISDAPNPYTEEEMESYERWQQGSRIQQKEPSPPHEENVQRVAKSSVTGSTVETPTGTVLVVATTFLLLLILAGLDCLP